MILDLERRFRKDGYTIGKLTYDGQYLCDTLEDTDRHLTSDMPLDEIKSIKVQDKTAIPVGEYQIAMSFSEHFGKVLPLLLHVPGFSGVRIHSGNTPADTRGCVLCGRNTVKGEVHQSRDYTTKVIDLIQKATRKGEKVTLKIHY